MNHISFYNTQTTCRFSANPSEDLELLGHEKIKACVQYFENVNLTTNLNKSTDMNFTLRQLKIKYKTTIDIDDFVLHEAENSKFLGIVLTPPT